MQYAVEAKGLVLRQVGGCGYFAEVHIRYVIDSSLIVQIEPDAVAEYDRTSGWGEAAEAGARLGMSLAGVIGTTTITKVRGMLCDTSPALVAIAAARAVWTASGFVVSPILASQVEACVLRGHKLSTEQLSSELLADGLQLPFTDT